MSDSLFCMNCNTVMSEDVESGDLYCPSCGFRTENLSTSKGMAWVDIKQIQPYNPEDIFKAENNKLSFEEICKIISEMKEVTRQ